MHAWPSGCDTLAKRATGSLLSLASLPLALLCPALLGRVVAPPHVGKFSACSPPGPIESSPVSLGLVPSQVQAEFASLLNAPPKYSLRYGVSRPVMSWAETVKRRIHLALCLFASVQPPRQLVNPRPPQNAPLLSPIRCIVHADIHARICSRGTHPAP